MALCSPHSSGNPSRSTALPLTRQAEMLKLSRSSLYYKARPVSPANLGSPHDLYKIVRYGLSWSPKVGQVAKRASHP